MRGSSASAEDGPDSVIVPTSSRRRAGNIERHRQILLDDKDAETGAVVVSRILSNPVRLQWVRIRAMVRPASAGWGGSSAHGRWPDLLSRPEATIPRLETLLQPRNRSSTSANRPRLRLPVRARCCAGDQVFAHGEAGKFGALPGNGRRRADDVLHCDTDDALAFPGNRARGRLEQTGSVLSVVVLPAPLPPIRATISPASTSRKCPSAPRFRHRKP